MDEKFPYGYDVNAYINKAFEQMKADFPWATKEMITEHNYYGIEKQGETYQYVSYSALGGGNRKAYPLNIDSGEFIRRIADGHDWELERANPVAAFIEVKAKNTFSGGWHLEDYRIQKHQLGGYSANITAGNRSAGGSRTFFIPASYFKLPWEEFLDRYLDLVSPGPFYVGRDDLERDPRIKEFLGF